MTLVIVTKPAVEPLTAAEAKARLGLGSEVADAVIEALITAARQGIDGAAGWIGRCLNTQTWDLILDDFPALDYFPPRDRGFYPQTLRGYTQSFLRISTLEGIVLPLAPVQSLTSVTYLDGDGIAQTLDASNYTLVKGEPARLVLTSSGSWPTAGFVGGSVKLRFVAGYGDAGTDVPEPLRTAVALQVAQLRSLMGRDPLLTAEAVTGVGSRTYAVGAGAADGIAGAVRALLDPYRLVLP